GRSLWMVGERDAARERLAEARTIALAVGRADLLAEAAITSGGVRAWTEAGLVSEPLVAALEEARAALPEEQLRLRSMVTARLAAELYFQEGSIERRRALTAESIEMARRLGDGPTLAYVLGAAHWGIYTPEDREQREATAREMLSIAEASGDRNSEV